MLFASPCLCYSSTDGILIRFGSSKEENSGHNTSGIDNISEAMPTKKEISEQAVVVHVGPVNAFKEELSAPSFSLGLTQLDTQNTPPDSPETTKREEAIQTEHVSPVKAANTKGSMQSEVPLANIARQLGADVDRIYKWATNHMIKYGLTLAAITKNMGTHMCLSTYRSAFQK
ncbi:hypothetical protein PIB30_077512 [Stylosanthes scabra]|uniref:Uncharacterized protein n=1 Tax=Stylosanthes scabra TaxID=79078 RepID=A0ABU6UPH1_9FABA|nr:hypothetical protein [Stylosanthes scabra]